MSSEPTPKRPFERCNLCGQGRRSHCDLDQPGVDHPVTCPYMHHEFRPPVAEVLSDGE